MQQKQLWPRKRSWEKRKEKKNNNHGTALAVSGNGVFKGRCYICGNCGHKSISIHSETMEALRTGKIRKIHKMHKIQTILQMYIKTQILKNILRQIIPTTTYLPERQDFKESVITAESEDIEEKIAGILKTISSEMLKEPTYVYQYHRTYHKTELKNT